MNILAPAPVRTPLVGQDGLMTAPWVMYFQKLNTRIGGTYSQTVDQNTAAILAMQAFESMTDTSSEGSRGLDAIDDLALMIEPTTYREEADLFLPEVVQNFEFETGIWTPTFTGST